MLLPFVVLLVVLVGPLLLERLERHVPAPTRPRQSTVDRKR